MKILHLGKYYSPIEGGIESINKFIVDSLVGNEQCVISFNNKRETSKDTVDGVSVVRASSWGVLASQPISFKYFSVFRNSLRTFNPDVVHFHYPNPLVALYILLNRKDYKLVVHWHSDVIAQKIIHKFVAPIEKLLLKRADYIIATSPNYRDNSEALAKYINKVEVIPCSINETNFKLKDSDLIKVDEIKRKYGNKPIVFFVGRHVEYKGLRYLLEAEQYVKSDCVFLIAGRGPLTDVLKKACQSDRIYWIDRLDDEELKLYFSASSILAFPSITKNEAFGVVLIESMYCGTPAVTFEIEGSGVNWVSIKNETCLEVPDVNAKEYAEAIDKLLSDKSLRKELGENSVKRVKKLFTKDLVAQKYRQLYENISKQL